MLHSSRQHLQSVNESYLKHFCHAADFAWQMFVASLATILHAICPGIFQTTGSRTIFKLNAILQARLQRAGTDETAHDA